MEMISSFLTFPPLSWWVHALDASKIALDRAEHFEKMTWRNRYRIAGANNSILLTVPLVNGRNQHVPMAGINIHNDSNWQLQHWRTLVSVYSRTPFFEHYADSLQQLYTTEFLLLTDFNLAALAWAKRQLKLKFELAVTDDYVKTYPPEIADLRDLKNVSVALPEYYQIFADRTGFIADLSILDLLFSEGPGAVHKLKSGD